MLQIAVVGGGWAGCAAGVELARMGCKVSLFEAARTLGGRARAVDVNGTTLDNGQHILLGAYSETLHLLRLVGIDHKRAFLRVPLQVRYPAGSGGMDFVASRLPAPWHLVAALLRAQGLALEDRLALARFSTTARWMAWQLNDDCSVSELLDRFDQTSRLIRLLWRPLCIAALNTPPERASAQIFLKVLRNSLGAKRSASDMLIPRSDLSALFPIEAARFIEASGGTTLTGKSVRQLRSDDGGWQLDAEPEMRFDGIVVATSASQAAALLKEHTDTSLLAFDYEPITTCYLQYGPNVRLTQPFYALLDAAKNGELGQFVFDRGQLNVRQRGLLSVVISAATDAISLSQDDLSKAVAQQLAGAFKDTALALPLWTQVISEKRATFSCRPSLQRPGNDVGVPQLALAGDYTASDYPATLESAVRSGVRAAQHLLDTLKSRTSDRASC